MSTVSSAGLIFLPVLSGISKDTPPGVDPTASQNFVIHQQLVEKLVDLVNAMPSNGNKDIQMEKENFAAKIHEHQAYLDQMDPSSVQ
ncbi:hypothetical protein EV401DRAFT_2083690 [Pisolithus croceorrhizus]|nr:hypothetical protein EV401DRAFT_2083690 [Pisolithus croceorrhizus]